MDPLKVLLVDDEEDFVLTVEERLRRRGICAEALTSGAAALQRLERCDFDVVIVDVRMPGMDGFELLRRIKAICPMAQVILLTGRRLLKESLAGIEQGAFDYLTKPIEIEDLVTAINRATSRG